MPVILNIDAGELPDEPDALLATAHRIHVACGGHAGDETTMRKTVAAAKKHGVEVAAHPSYEDRAGFGRRTLQVAPDVLGVQVASQCTALVAIARDLGVTVVGAKPHGALYHDTLRDRQLAGSVLEAIVRVIGPAAQIVTQPGALMELSRLRGLRALREGFADRGVGPDGRLIPRGQPGAMIEEPARAAAQAQALVALVAIDTVCVHGDGPNALAIARAVRRALSS